MGGGAPLAGLLLALLAVQQATSFAFPFQSIFSSSSSTTTTTTTTTTSGGAQSGAGGIGTPGPLLRLRANKLRRPESCRESLPRKSEDLPALVITGRVKEVYLAGEQEQPAQSQAIAPVVVLTSEPQQATSNKALIEVGRVIKGNAQLAGSDIIISGFNSTSSQPCPNYVKPNDTLILLLEPDGEHKYTIQGSNLLAMNLSNLDRVNAIAADEPFKRRGPIEDILCEAHYCAYGRCVVNERTNQTSCQCPSSCPPLPAPVCGSDNATYANECQLIQEGCRRQKPLFVTKEAAC